GNLLFNLQANRSDYHWKNGTYKNYKKEGTKNFLAFLNKKDFLRSVYIPLSFQLKAGMKVYVQLQNNKRIDLGAISPLSAYNKIFVLYVDHISGAMISSGTHFFIYLLKKSLKIGKRGELFVDNYKLGQVISEQLYGEDILKFIPDVGYSSTFLMLGPQDSVTEADFPKEFSVFISYQTKDGHSFKSLIPDWTCRKERQEINLDLPHFEPLKL
ncbi:MAG: hypothetical protein OXJ52_06105, partial [Oligoflexia bacterium]|nr:hypothetical protein [Oligoflexia bacterium]